MPTDKSQFLDRWHNTQNVDSTVMAFCELAGYGNDHDIIGNRDIVIIIVIFKSLSMTAVTYLNEVN